METVPRTLHVSGPDSPKRRWEMRLCTPTRTSAGPYRRSLSCCLALGFLALLAAACANQAIAGYYVAPQPASPPAGAGVRDGGIPTGKDAPLEYQRPAVTEEPLLPLPAPTIVSPPPEPGPSRPGLRASAPQAKQAPFLRVHRDFLTRVELDVSREVRELAWGRPAEVVRSAEQALAAAAKARDTNAARQALTTLGALAYYSGEFNRAEQFFQQALAKDKELGNLRDQALTQTRLGAVYSAWGRHRKAVSMYRDALDKFRQTADTRRQGMVLNNLGVAFENWGRYRTAQESYRQALDVASSSDELRALALENMSSLERAWGKFGDAVGRLKEALNNHTKTGDLEGQAAIHRKLGETYRDWHRDDSALEHFGNALEALRLMGAPTNPANKAMGDQLLDMGKIRDAEPYLLESGDKASLGRLFLLRSDFRKARQYYKELLSAAQKSDLLDDLFAAHTGLGKADEALNNLPQAQESFTRGMSVAEAMRSRLWISERKDFFEHRVEGFCRSEAAKGLTAVLMKQKKAAQSIVPAETIRSRGFADSVSRKADGSWFNVPADVLEREEELTDPLASWKKALNVVPRQNDPARYDRIRAQISAAERQLNAFVETLRKEHPAYAAVKYPKPIGLPDCVVRPEEYVICLQLLDDGLAVQVIKGKTLLYSDYQRLSLKAFHDDVQRFLAPFQDADLGSFDPEIGKRLFRTLLSNAVAQVPAGTPIIIVPDGILALLPFEVLITGGTVTWKQRDWGPSPEGLTYVGDSHPVSSFSSLTMMKLIRTLPPSKKLQPRLLVFADPVFHAKDARASGASELRISSTDKQYVMELMSSVQQAPGGGQVFERLPLTGRLARELSSLYAGNADAFTGIDATKENLLRTLSAKGYHYDRVVFATHGLASFEVPGIMEPTLVLAMVPTGTDGFLTMTDVMSLDMAADLACLIGCQTAVGRYMAGEGVMSMGTAFQYAGAKAVVMSLWSVSEESSVLLFKEFFKGRKEGKSTMVAWRAAVKAVRAAGFDHPFFWGPFILAGEVQAGQEKP